MQATYSICCSVIRMAFSFLLFASIAVAVGFGHPQDAGDSPVVEQREIGEYRADLKTFMKLSKSDDPQVERNAIFNLCTLHDEVVRDTRFIENRMLQGFRATAAKRLDGYAKDVEKQSLREARDKKRSQGSSARVSNDGSAVTDQTADTESAEIGDDNGAFNEEEGLNVGDDVAIEAFQFASASYYSLGELSGGPNQMFNYVGGRFAPPWDHGPELVALIENTINPSSWQANGGSGAIHYFQPLRVLVISSTQRVNDNTLDFLNTLRRAHGIQVGISN